MTSAFAGSFSVTALKCRSVSAGHCAFIHDTAWVISSALSGDSGCEMICFATRIGKEFEAVWVAMSEVDGMYEERVTEMGSS